MKSEPLRSCHAGSSGLGATVMIACAVPLAAAAPSEGGLYIAGYEFNFDQAASRGLSQNPKGRRFFVLTLAPNAGALTASAPKSSIALRERVIRSNGVLLVCQRDIDKRPYRCVEAGSGSRRRPWISSSRQHGSSRTASATFRTRTATSFRKSNEALRRLRATCS